VSAACTGIDTSVAVPLLVQTHEAHDAVHRWASGRVLSLAGHALVETYSVLTRLPGDLRLAPLDAVRLLEARLATPLVLEADVAARLPAVLAGDDVAGGACYDALVALAALGADVPLATRDARARSTYDAVGVKVVVVPGTVSRRIQQSRE
jgi:predicted nucleic acid-binding protein